jgi:hypothetical protein
MSTRWNGAWLACGQAARSLAVLLLLGVVACSPSPSKLNEQIAQGEAAKALSAIEAQLADNPANAPTLQLLAVKARLAMCASRDCVSNTTLLAPVAGLLQGLPAQVPMDDEKTPPLVVADVVAEAVGQFAALPTQPEALLALRRAMPEAQQLAVDAALFQPALTLMRQGELAAAGRVLMGLGQAKELDVSTRTVALALAGLVTRQTYQVVAHQTAMRSQQATIGKVPHQAGTLLPWVALLGGGEVSGTLNTMDGPTALRALTKLFGPDGWPELARPALAPGIAEELNWLAQQNPLPKRWADGWAGATHAQQQLALWRLSVWLKPDQPQVWAQYLPALVAQSSQLQGPVADLVQSDLPVTALTSATQAAVLPELLAAAGKLTDKPGAAAPLVVFAYGLQPNPAQMGALDKLAQDLVRAANAQGDVSATLAIVQARPEVALNNRQQVVPLLVERLRSLLRSGQFDAAIDVGELLTQRLKLDVALDSLVLEEVQADLNRQNLAQLLAADTPTVLLQPQAAAALDLGPLFGFARTYFSDRPNVLTAQVMPLIQGAAGVYGPATALWRLGPQLLDDPALNEDAQHAWLAKALTQSLLADDSLDGPKLARLATQLAQVHPNVSIAPIVQAALQNSADPALARSLWQEANPALRQTLAALAPDYARWMQAVDAQGRGKLQQVAQLLGEMAPGPWFDEADALRNDVVTALAGVVGLYVPVSPQPTVPTAMVRVRPAVLDGGPLTELNVTWLNRVGTLVQDNPATVTSDAAAVLSRSVPLTYAFADTAMRLPQPMPGQPPFVTTFGDFRAVRLLASTASDTAPMLELVTPDGVVPLVRVSPLPDGWLTPAGTYVLTTGVGGRGVSETAQILPPGSLLTLVVNGELRPPAATEATKAPLVLPLAGSVRHPAAVQPLPLQGWFEPEAGLSTFRFAYPLADGGMVQAEARCQTLGGPIVCGAHHVHSPRHRFASLMVGRQTQESLAGVMAARQERLAMEQRDVLTALQAAMGTLAAQQASSTAPVANMGMAGRVATLAAQIPLPVVTPTVVTPTMTVSGTQNAGGIGVIGGSFSGTLVVSGSGVEVEPRAGRLLPPLASNGLETGAYERDEDE